jgi:hypothetical protein
MLTIEGVVPRAAQLLFDKLDGPKHGRAQSSGLRTPARYSVGSPQAFNKPSFEKIWQMKATYVEVRLVTYPSRAGLEILNPLTGSTMSIYEICSSPTPPLSTIAAQLLFERIQKAGSS